MGATKPCVRCSQMPEDHPVPAPVWWSMYPPAGQPVRRVEIGGCASYVEPAPWWMRATTRLFGARGVDRDD